MPRARFVSHNECGKERKKLIPHEFSECMTPLNEWESGIFQKGISSFHNEINSLPPSLSRSHFHTYNSSHCNYEYLIQRKKFRQ